MHKKLLLGLIGTIIAGHAFAETTTQTIPTQSYVDTNFQTKIPAGTTGSVVTYNGTSNGQTQFNEMPINEYDYVWFGDDPDDSFGLGDSLAKTETIKSALEYTIPADGLDNAGGAGVVNPTTNPNKVQFLPVFSDTDGRFSRMRTVRALDENIGSWQTFNVVPTLTAVNAGMANKQDKMTCTRWLDNAEHTDENCLLWQLNN